MLRRVFDEMYYAIEELAGKYPNEVIVPFKVERINEVLGALRGSVQLDQGGFPIAPQVRNLSRRDCPQGSSLASVEKAPDEISATGGRRLLSPSAESSMEDSIYKHLRLVEEGLTYSDVMLIMKWYKVLPR